MLTASNLQAEEQTTSFGYLTNRITHNDMEPTLAKGEFIASDPRYYENNNIKRGDLIVFESPKKDGRYWVKRVIGLPGEIIETKIGQVLVNGEPLKEVYVLPKNTVGITRSLNKKHEVQPGHYYVLGDNRDNSMDSRLMGPISKGTIVAKVISIYFSPSLPRIGQITEINYH